MSYSVGVRNIFEALIDETDDHPSVKTPQTKLEEDKKPQKPAIKKTEPVVGDTPAGKGRGNNQNRNREGGNQRSSPRQPRTDRPRDGQDRGDRQPRPPRQDGDRPRPPREDRERAPRGDGERGPRPPRQEGERPPRRPRQEGDRPKQFEQGGAFQPTDGERRQRPHRGEDRDKERWQNEGRENRGENRGKRIYDRRSGTGHGLKENKKSGGGPGNWGDEKDPNAELEAETISTEEAKAEQAEQGATAATDDTAAPAVDAWGSDDKKEKKEDEEPATFSIDEYRQRNEAKKNALPSLPPPRKAGEGIADKDKEKWAAVPLTPAQEKEKNEADKSSEESAKSSKKETVPLDKYFSIKPRERPAREDRPRRDDDRPREPRKGGDKRREGGAKKEGVKPKPKGPDASINVKNDQEFPTLATKA